MATDPYTRAALEAGRHEETKQVSQIDALQVSATALLGFEGAAVALVNSDTWWNTISAYFLFASIVVLIFNLVGLRLKKPLLRPAIQGVSHEKIQDLLDNHPTRLEDKLLQASLNALKKNKKHQIRGRQRTLTAAVVALAVAAACRAAGAIFG
ncbi:hypothetical protein HW130_18520 [Streptomyces sp. PKU-EA00015]|uniref:hypothetical protein n=1 Tax=Streptomyces sp. PKU-EA00015 TaxID=2748326 RepID=UPI00159F74EC|nr:hypothetical protein [Streptomyces sp. PKU-EA00015]NWF28238.1 hypothetical protein [Streptomyces sp. PKU-EA00015]